MKSPLIPIAKVDQAVRRIERWGTPEDRAALGAATRLFTDKAVPTKADRQASRQAIIAIAQKIPAHSKRRRAPAEI